MNRRGFFKTITGFAAGVYAAFVPGKMGHKAELVEWIKNVKDDSLVEEVNDEITPCHIQVNTFWSTNKEINFAYTIWGERANGDKIPIKAVYFTESGERREEDLI